jgi:UDP-glucose 4-epimerase
MVIPRFVHSALVGAALEVHGDGTQTRSFCHVSDTIRALKGLTEATDLSGEIFNVGSSDRIRVIDLAERVLAMTGSKSELKFVPHEDVYGLGIEDVLHREPLVDKIRAAIGWRPTVGLDEILRDVIDYAKTAPVAIEAL